jgi:release factor glutamine methyltransferase
MTSEATVERRGHGRDTAAAIADASERLTRAGIESARLDAELLMAAAAGVSRATLIAAGGEIDAVALERFEPMVARRAAREPLAYIVGHREFFSLEFAVRPGVLIPRPETETVVEAALDFLRGRMAATVLDIGTGSGAIAIALAVSVPRVWVVTVDISKVSLEIAEENARHHRCADRIAFVRGDCFAALEDGVPPFAPFDLIVSNPPYIAETEFSALAPEVRDFEPRAALEGGRDGMDFYRKIAAGLRRWLAPAGEVILEVGAGQAEAVEAIMCAAGCVVSSRRRDLAGIDRVVRARRVT